MKLQTRKCPDCGQQQVRLTSRTDFKSPIQWGCGSCGRIDTAEAPLTRREEEVVRLICQGKSGKEIAIALGIAVKTAETHRANIHSKLKVHGIAQLVIWAIRNRIVDGYLFEPGIQNGDAEKPADFHRAT